MPEQQLESVEPIISKTDLLDLKAILLDSRTRVGAKVVCKVPSSRYIKILTDYWALNSIYVEGAKENYAENTKWYILSGLDPNGNKYKIVRQRGQKEAKGKCNMCDCEKGRLINPSSGTCYYKEMINNNYTTKIK